MRELTKEERIMFTKFYIYNERLKELGYESDRSKRREKFEELKSDYLEEYNQLYNNENIENRDIMLKAYEEILLALGFTDLDLDKTKIKR